MARTPAAALRAVLTGTDRLAITRAGTLMIAGCRAEDLAAIAGTPVYVLAEDTLRANYRRFLAAFSGVWPGAVTILNSVKANANQAVQLIAREEGCGCDCSSLGELELARLAGAKRQALTLNGCNKQEGEIALALNLGAAIVVDALDDLDMIEAIAHRERAEARLLLRLRPVDPDYFATFQSDSYPYPGSYQEPMERKKWGLSRDAAARAIELVEAQPRLRLEGFHGHIGRLSRDPQLFARNHGCFGRQIAELHGATGYWPDIVDIGGGWPRERDPEARTVEPNTHTIENYASAACGALAAALAEARGKRPLPELWVEPGRYVLGNAGVLLARVGVIKRDAGRCWVNIDASGELALLVQSYGARNHLTVATGMHRAHEIVADVVGPTCVAALIAADCVLPAVARGELVALLDAGAYAESQASQFNSIPRPATLLARDGEADIIRHRERLADLLRLQAIPPRLARATA